MIIFFLALNVLLPRIRRHGSNQVILGLSVILFLCCTAHFALEFNHFHFTLVSKTFLQWTQILLPLPLILVL